MSGGGEYPYPKYTWSPAGGWWAKTKNWQRKTGVALVALAAVAGPIALFSSSNHIKFPAEERRKLTEEDDAGEKELKTSSSRTEEEPPGIIGGLF
ncbi:hypothetical protein PC129_g2262 [Phytophthora cactorum]|uniref:Uncharacterized protein n=1 Tax=Phytophthora cactorum TaxID=29920 RepID=A0A8T0ZRQ2_9STRA|nr:hypothetical protein Pcac1_g17969 [Phytophthora cactorum]KAG3169592.1 hypothetical protein PI126_g2739 [Phytophthora idaei]KAG2841504.1 hypothetical protein PC112_g3343 [Phytophthora cactorum]KAG2842381.1 hypothetical protein PC111_g2736 [Phytophthora cactorum]KAG2865621.1 hypothetical protein PC113_g3563 [Phytophthora cactorum]